MPLRDSDAAVPASSIRVRFLAGSLHAAISRSQNKRARTKPRGGALAITSLEMTEHSSVKNDFFVGIGVQKCASTWLYEILLDHPQVALGRRKEVDFFSYNFGRGYQWYESHFSAAGERRVFGEISPSYFIDKNVPERVKAYAPDAKLLISLRDPVERAISNHRHEVRLGNFKGGDLSFEAGLENNPLYIEQSRYGTHLQRWLVKFPASQMLIVFQEDINREPIKVAREVYRFFDVDTGHVSNALGARPNESRVYRFPLLEQMRFAARGSCRYLKIDSLWRTGQKAGLQWLYRRLNRRPPSARIPSVSADTRWRLSRMLEGEIRMVEELTGRSLPQWRNQDCKEGMGVPVEAVFQDTVSVH